MWSLLKSNDGLKKKKEHLRNSDVLGPERGELGKVMKMKLVNKKSLTLLCFKENDN